MKRSRLYSGAFRHPMSRKEARDIGAAFFFTGKPCVHGHVSLRYASGACTACQKAKSNKASYPDASRGMPKLRDIDDALADKALARSLKEVWDE